MRSALDLFERCVQLDRSLPDEAHLFSINIPEPGWLADLIAADEVAADVETPGAITIPAKKLTEIARELPPSPVKMAAAGEQRITLDCGRSHFKILGLPRDEFPSFPTVRFNESWKVKSGDLQKLIAATSFAVSTEGMKVCPKCGMGNLWTERRCSACGNGLKG